MTTILIMFAGVLVGATVFPSLGSRPGFLEELGAIGLKSLIFALLPILFSVALVYPLSKRFLERPEEGEEGGED